MSIVSKAGIDGGSWILAVFSVGSLGLLFSKQFPSSSLFFPKSSKNRNFFHGLTINAF